MTVSASYAPDNYAGDGVVTTFAITFEFLSVSTNVKVSIKVNSTGVITEKTASTHYNISGTDVIFTGGNIPASGETVIVELNPDFKQTSDYAENAALPAETLETDLDERTLEGQINKDRIDRSFKLDSSVDISSVTMTTDLPSSGTEILTVTSTSLGRSTAVALGVVEVPVSVANGGTGTSSHTSGNLLIGAGTSAITSNSNYQVVSGVLTASNGSSSAGRISFKEDSDNGTNTCTVRGPASVSSNVTLTLPEATDTLVGKATTDTMTNKTLTAPVISTISNTGTLTLPTSTDTLVGKATTDVLTNKTLDADGNVITNVGSSEIKSELITGQSDTAIAAGDSVIYSDVSDSNNLKKDTVQGILDLATGVDAASQAEMETATDVTKFTSPGRTQYHPGVAKAWIKFNGTGTVAIDASYNITSITDNSTGNYTVTIATDFSSTEFCTTGMFGNEANATIIGFFVGSSTASTVRIQCHDSSFNSIDVLNLNLAFYGDQA